MYPLKTKKSYDPNNLAATGNIYTTVYLWNYISGNFSEYVWSHPGVDIIPQVKNDNVYACLDGVVDTASTNASNGNFIILKHENVPDPDNFNKTTTLYSCHLHLDSMNVSKWDMIKEWDIIGKSWSTGNSTWEHLHFQIDRANALFHPYWPFSFKEASDAGLWFMEAVNKWLNLENGKKYTINPLVYLDSIPYKWIETKSTKTASLLNDLPDDLDKWLEDVSDKPSNNKPNNNSNEVKKYFKDVSTDNQAINYLAKIGITKWFSDGTFKPENNISRAELLAFTFNFAKKSLSNANVNFSDVNKTDWSYKYIATAKESGIINWFSDGTFKPNNSITRAEAIAVILNTIIWKNKIWNMSWSLFTDVVEWSWQEKYIYYVVQNDLFNVSWNKFYPDNFIKRKEVAEILYNLRDKV